MTRPVPFRRSARRPRLAPAVAPCIAAALACGGERAGEARPDSTAPVVADTVLAATPAPRDTALERAARTTLRFLAGEVPFDSVRLADTVALHLAPEGGGTSVRRARAELRRPEAWVVASGRMRYSFVPPRGMTDTTLEAGVHFDCRRYTLASRVPSLADRPHVGVMLAPGGAAGCLRTWNATFVFDGTGAPARLVAAVYDQWEW